MDKVEFENLRYNAATLEFEALVAMKVSGAWAKYACSFKAPLDTDYQVVTSQLLAQAKRQRDTKKGMVSHRSPVPRPQTIARRPQLADNSLWSSFGFASKDAA